MFFLGSLCFFSGYECLNFKEMMFSEGNEFFHVSQVLILFQVNFSANLLPPKLGYNS